MPEIEFRVGGVVRVVPAVERETLLECALRQGVNAPYSCLEGVCGTCEAKLLEGDVNEQGHGGIRGEGERVLTCQARIREGCARVTVDYGP